LSGDQNGYDALPVPADGLDQLAFNAYASLCRTGLPIARGTGNTSDILLSPASGVGYCPHKRIYPCNSRSFL
jgi:hypothetical protein